MLKRLEKWALQRLLKRVAENLPYGQDRLAQLWADNKDEIFEKVSDAIKQTIGKIIKKALEKQGIKVLDTSNN